MPPISHDYTVLNDAIASQIQALEALKGQANAAVDGSSGPNRVHNELVLHQLDTKLSNLKEILARTRADCCSANCSYVLL